MKSGSRTKLSRRLRWGAGVAVVGLFFSCAVGPDYHRPAVDSPDAYRRAASDHNASFKTNSFADVDWWNVYADPQLNSYINEALTNSWDIKIAAARVLQAEANAKIVRSQFFPNIYANADLVTSRTSEKGPLGIPGVKPQHQYGDVFLSMNGYELDLWGHLRRANEAARAQLLQSQETQHLVRQTLVAQVATTYFQLLELDLELQIGRAASLNRSNSLVLTQSRQEGGVSSMQDVYQARVLVATAEASIVTTLRFIEQTENQMNILLGRNPGQPVLRDTSLTDYQFSASVPPGLPSALLERRPDIRAAEQQMIAANANIGEAKAAFYPKLTLTGAYGYQSVGLSDLFTSPARAWQFGPAISFPLFTGGRLRGNLKLARANFEETVANYQQTIQNAFRDVSDALIARQRNQEFYARQQELTQANRDAAQLAAVRYEGGVTSYLEVLYNEQQLFDAELLLAQARRDEMLSVVELYRALGGGWETTQTNQIVVSSKQP